MDKTKIEAPQIVSRGLRKAVELHGAGEYGALYTLYDETAAEASSLGGISNRQVSIALTFMDSWGDSGGHEWLYYEGIGKDDWPRLAQEIIKALETGGEITNPLILEHFDLSGRPSLLRRIKGLFKHE
jgi:hypothetical protein